MCHQTVLYSRCETCSEKCRAIYKIGRWIDICWTRESFTHIDMSPLPVKGCRVKVYCLWAGRDLYRATPATPQDLGFCGLTLRPSCSHPTTVQFSPYDRPVLTLRPSCSHPTTVLLVALTAIKENCRPTLTRTPRFMCCVICKYFWSLCSKKKQSSQTLLKNIWVFNNW